jgi:hypothetical protein
MPRNIDDARRYFSPERKIIRSMPEEGNLRIGESVLFDPIAEQTSPILFDPVVDTNVPRRIAKRSAKYPQMLPIPESRTEFLQEKLNLEEAIRRGEEALMRNPNNEQLRQSVEGGKKRLMELIDSDLMPAMPMPEER